MDHIFKSFFVSLCDLLFVISSLFSSWSFFHGFFFRHYSDSLGNELLEINVFFSCGGVQTFNSLTNLCTFSIETWHVVKINRCSIWDSNWFDFIVNISERLIITNGIALSLEVTFFIEDDTFINMWVNITIVIFIFTWNWWIVCPSSNSTFEVPLFDISFKSWVFNHRSG